MAIDNATTHANAIKTVYEQEIQSAVYSEAPFMSFCKSNGMWMQKQGDSGARFFVDSALGSSPETFSDGDALPTATSLTRNAGTIAYTFFQDSAQITQHALTQARNGHYGVLDTAMSTMIKRFLNFVDDTLVTSLVSAIDDDATYAGLTRTTEGCLPIINTVGGKLTISALDETLADMNSGNYHMGNPSDYVIFASFKQAQQLSKIANGVGGVTLNVDLGSGVLDPGKMQNALSYNGIPVVILHNLSESVMLIVKKSGTKIVEAEPFKVEPMAKTSWIDTYGAIWAGCVIVPSVFHCAKIESLT